MQTSALRFEGSALKLGDSIELGSVGRRQFDTSRANALLAAAYGVDRAEHALPYLRGAIDKERAGETPLALIYLALAGLPKLETVPEAEWRLSAAAGLMTMGVAPEAILRELSLPPQSLKYSPDQPRVPAGSGRESGRWTNGDDTGSETGVDSGISEGVEHQQGGPSGIQIADASDDWAQYLNPIGPAHADEKSPAPFNGAAPNNRHSAAVAHAISLYQSHGFIISSNKATAVNVPGFSTPRVYDFVAQDPATGYYIGVEVKTTLYESIFFDNAQVDKDVAIYTSGGGYARSLGKTITRVGYEAFCATCSMINLRSVELTLRLFGAGIRVRAYQYPGEADFQ